jgi:polyhydroxybutyrate depolymerase
MVFLSKASTMKILLPIFFILLTGSLFSQQTINGSVTHDGLTRTYILYVPASYSAGTPAPLVFNFHGYTSNATQQMFYGDFRPIADTAGFLLVHPMGTLDGSNQPYWNSGWGGSVDDIGFTSALIDSLLLDYSINQDRIFSTGMSNGGFMSYTLACELSTRIAAIASVTGAFNSNQIATCNPTHPMPVMEIHGTADGTVAYNGSAGIASTASTLSYWSTFNNCDIPAIMTPVPNINTIDGCTAEHYIYPNGQNGVDVEHYKIIGGGHTWPDAPVTAGVTNRDIDASIKIWEFFMQYDINGKIGFNSLSDFSTNNMFSISPNPAQNTISINGIENIEPVKNVKISTIFGQKVMTIENFNNTIDVSNLDKGIYFLTFLNGKNTEIIRFVKQ